MSNHKTDILFPVGRLVMGSLTVAQTKNKEGQPLLNKDGSPRVNYFFAVAVPKNGGADWKQTPWGQKMVAVAQAGHPQGWQLPKFSWKIIDGDSTTPNEDGHIPSSREGFPGNWVVRFSSGFAPKTLVADGSAATPAEAIKVGHYVEVLGEADANDSSSKPGIYINHKMIAHAGFGPEIASTVQVDGSQVGFGQAALPVGASATPVAAMVAPTPPAPSTPVVTQPHTAILAGPPGAPAAPPGPPAAPSRVMLPAAQGFSYESYVAKGWSDEQLIAAGMMQA